MDPPHFPMWAIAPIVIGAAIFVILAILVMLMARRKIRQLREIVEVSFKLYSGRKDVRRIRLIILSALLETRNEETDCSY